MREGYFTCLVAASDKFLRVQRQFWTSLWLGSVRWRPSACMPPEESQTEVDVIRGTQKYFHCPIKFSWLNAMHFYEKKYIKKSL